MAMTGFDPTLVRSSISKVESAYEELIRALANDMQSSFVDTMAEYWACNQAQTFFTGAFKPAADELLSSSYRIFQSVVTSMNSAAQSWAQQTDSEWSPVSFNGELKTIAVDNIKENINGVRGVDEANATNTAGRLQTIASNASSALESAKSAVQNCGFIGRNQEEQLVTALNTIRNNVNSATSDLTDATKKDITDTVAAYGDLASKVESAFSATE